MGLDTPTSGTALVQRKAVHRAQTGRCEKSARCWNAKAFHPARTAYSHLRCLAYTNDVPLARVEQVLGIVGLTEVGTKRAGKFSLGMGQRLGIAGPSSATRECCSSTSLSTGSIPRASVGSEPAAQPRGGGTVRLVSSHLISEMALTADRLVGRDRGGVPSSPTRPCAIHRAEWW